MPTLDLESLLAPVSVAEPAGPNLEYDRDFVALERLAAGKPERQMGESVQPAEEPEWKALGQGAQALLARSKDLRVASHLTKALLRTAGIVGFAEGVHLVRLLLERYWDGVHPRLDPDDDNNPTMRVNTLASLCDGATVSALRLAPLANARAVGKVTLRDVLVATGEMPTAADQTAPEMASIEAVFDAVDLDALVATTDAVKSARQDVGTIEVLVTEKVGVAQTANLSKLSVALDQAHKHLVARLERRTPIEADDTSEIALTQAGDGQPPVARGGGGGLGQIKSRDDVVRVLDLIAAYYQRNEPSSPVPLLLHRAKRLAKMTFLDIVKDMAPDAMSQVDLIRGPTDEGSSS